MLDPLKITKTGTQLKYFFQPFLRESHLNKTVTNIINVDSPNIFCYPSLKQN